MCSAAEAAPAHSCHISLVESLFGASRSGIDSGYCMRLVLADLRPIDIRSPPEPTDGRHPAELRTRAAQGDR